jgi:hypothetical protein
MPKAPPPPWTARDCRFDYLVNAAIGQGHGAEVTMNGIESVQRAEDIRRGVYRCAGHRGVSAWVSWQHDGEWTTRTTLWPPDKQPDGTYTLVFAVTDKRTARKRHLAVYGADRAAWPYNPRAGKSPADVAAWQAQGRDERGHRVK